MSHHIFYAAYGSNMDSQQIRDRLGSYGEIRSIGKAVLMGYRLAFNKLRDDGSGAANIVEDPNHRVEVALFELTEEAMQALDRWERVPQRNYRRVSLMAILPDGKSLPVETYQALRLSPDGRDLVPNKEYITKIYNGAREFGLSDEYIEVFIRRWMGG